MNIKKILQRLKSNKGETLMEVLVATAIFALLAVLMVSLIMGSTSTNTAALRVQREDMDIMARIDSDGANADMTSENTESIISPATKLKVEFASGGVVTPFTIESDGVYYTYKGKQGVGTIVKRFVPKEIY